MYSSRAFPDCPRAVPAVCAHFCDGALDSAMVAGAHLYTSVNGPLGTWRSMASVLPAPWRVPTREPQCKPIPSSPPSFWPCVRDGFHRVSVIAGMIDMVEFTYARSSSAPRRAFVGSLLEDTSIHRFYANPDHQGLGVLATMESMPKPQ